MNFSVETNRLILRDFTEDDRTHFFRYFKEPEAQKDILKIQSTDQYLQKTFENGLRTAKQQHRRTYHLMIVDKNSLLPIGNCSFLSAITHSRESQIGWHLSASYRGRGFITETASCLLELGFEKHLVEAINADVFLENAASIRVMEKIGMQIAQSNFLLRWIRGFQYGEARAIVRYQIEKQDWLKRTKT